MNNKPLLLFNNRELFRKFINKISEIMKLKSILIIILLYISINTFTQPSEITYLGNVARSGFVNNGTYGPFNIGFSFTFFGNTYTQFYVSSNGLVLFGAGSTDGTEDPIPTAATPNNFIAAFWDDLTVDATGNILYTTVGAAPNRKLVIQFRNMGFYPFPPFFGTFSTILYETTNNIQVQFRIIVDKSSSRAHGESAVIGLENSDGTAGVQYAYHNPEAISTGKAIQFTPSGSTYNINPNAIYDGVYLTRNLSLPEPGITLLTAPGKDAIIGSDYNFEWGASSNASSYILLISNYPDLSEPAVYDPGTSLSYNITGLILDTTYYWGVFSTNTTGTTWCEIERFYTSSSPPLAPVSQTKWMDQNQEEIIQLKYTGGDAGPKNAIVTTLPSEGQLYQYNEGARGALISTVPANVTDPGMNVIYFANGLSGNGVGSFSFMIHDGTGDSPEGAITINVIPPGPPNFLLAAKGTGVEIQFDRPMNDPAGKQNQFTVTVNGTPVPVSSVSLKEGDPYSFTLVLATPLTGTETVTVAYTQGDVSGVGGGLLETFTEQLITLRSQTITFGPIPDKKYGDLPFAATATTSSGLSLQYSSSNLSVATVTGNIITVVRTGTTLITVRQAGNATYAPARYTRSLTVTKASLTFTADNKTRRYNEPNPELTYTITGFKTGEDQSVIDILPSIQTTAELSSPAGNYPITLSGGSDNNYNFIFVNGTLSVVKTDQTITFTNIPLRLLVGESVTLAATSTSGLPVSFESLNPSFATINGSILTGVSRGTARIRAFNQGDDNYNASEALADVVVYSTHKDILNLFTPNNDGINDYWEIPELGAYGKCDVKVYNRWGKLVFASTNYDNRWDGTSDGVNLPEGPYYFVIKHQQNQNVITGTVNILR